MRGIASTLAEMIVASFVGALCGLVVIAMLALLLLGAMGVWTYAHAQGPALIQNTATELRASQNCNEVRGTGAQTATLTPPAGQYVYINSLEAGAFAQGGSVGISTPASLTSTNLPASLTFGLFGATTTTINGAGAVYQNFYYGFAGNPLKSANAGTAVTVVTPNVTNLGWHLALCGYFAP